MKFFRWLAFFSPAALLLAQPSTPPMPVKVVIVSMFQGEGKEPGERRLWQERLHLDQRLPLPAADSDVWTDSKGVLVFTTGIGVSNAAASTMALGLDPRFDLTHAYWLIAGISGIDPADGSMGSAAWARYVVDGGLAHELDAREIPVSWSTGYTPLGSPHPFDRNGRPMNPSQVFTLNRGLVQWAYTLTKDTVLPDSAAMAKRRKEFTGYPNAQRPPFVLLGDNLSDSTFWHGEKMTKFGNDWVDFWTDHKGNFVTKAMEDSGTLQSLRNLARAGRVDFDRVLVLRTASNYTMQSPDMTAWQSLARERGASLSAFNEALEAAFLVGNRVVQNLLKHWPKYEASVPTVATAAVEALADDPNCTADDRRFMARAYELARSSVAHGNHPFSALLVKDGKIIFEYENTIYSTHDLTQHAETGLIGKATQKFDPATLAECTLYASTEPCIMCCGAIRWAGIRQVVYGTTSSQLSQVIALLYPPRPELAHPPLLLECREVFARTEPGISVRGPLMEEEGIAVHQGYWASDPVVKASLAKVQK